MTRYPELDPVLAALGNGLGSALGDRLIGLYLFGSIATGEFDPARSDVDFITVLTQSVVDITALQSMHSRIRGTSRWAERLEGIYLPIAALHGQEPLDTLYPSLDLDGSVRLDRQGSKLLLKRHLLATSGIRLVGPEPSTLVEPASPDELRKAVRGVLRESWLPELAEPRRLRIPGFQVYAVQTMCRALYTIEHGTLTSKVMAARWAIEHHARWARLIEAAARWQRGMAWNAIDDTVAFMRFVVGLALDEQ